jgi:hypothetical protein
MVYLGLHAAALEQYAQASGFGPEIGVEHPAGS